MTLGTAPPKLINVAIEHRFLRCTACGSVRPPRAFGVRETDTEPPEYTIATLVKSFHGDRGIRWREEPLPLDLARAQLACHQAAVKKLEEEIRAAEAQSFD